MVWLAVQNEARTDRAGSTLATHYVEELAMAQEVGM